MVQVKVVSKVACTVLIGLSLMAIAHPVTANPVVSERAHLQNSKKLTSILNPNPSIFSEAPYNHSQLKQKETLSLIKQAQTPAPSEAEQAPSEVEVKPWSEAQENRVALVRAVGGQFNVRLMNLTNTEVTYELVGHTNQRQLTGNTSFLLEDLAMPVTVTVLREDGGLVKITPRPAAPGILELRLDEALNLDQDRRAVRVREGGSLLIY